MQYLYKQFVTI